jgi:hypothetical protein
MGVLKVHSLADEPTTATEFREALGLAIGEHDNAVDRQRKVEAARAHADDTLSDCRARVREAEAALAEVNEPARLAAAAVGEETGASASDLEAALVTAQNDLQLARSTKNALEERSGRERAAVERARCGVIEAVADVMKAAVPVADMLRGAEELQQRLVSERLALRFLFNSSFVDEANAKAVARFLMDNTLPGYNVIEHHDYSLHPVTQAWRATVDALTLSAEAPAVPTG